MFSWLGNLQMKVSMRKISNYKWWILPSLLETYLPLQFKVLLCFSVFFRAATRPKNDSSSFLCSKNEILGCDNLFDLCHLSDRRELWSCTFWESTRTHQCQAVSAPDGRCQNPPRKMHSFSFMTHNSFQMIQTQYLWFVENWLVVWNFFLMFHNIWDNPSQLTI
jgi:hypothetical protein